MNIALLHYWLTNMRGGEKVLATLGEILPNADIFTHAYIPSHVPCFNRFNVKETFISRLPFGRCHPQAYLPLLPIATRALDLSDYELIVSSESGPIKGINKPVDVKHICYCHTPMRYLWDMYDEYFHSAGIMGKIAMKIFTRYLRYEDLKSVENVDTFIANSAFVAERIRRIYGRDSIVIHPPVDVDFFQTPQNLQSSVAFESESYYLYAGEICDYKHPELAVEACLRTGRRLVVVGNGKMRDALMRQVGGRTEIVFLGRISDEELRNVFANARALLFPGIEDFGIVPVEAQAAGTPVIALGKGGALETVCDGETGIFFNELTVKSLCEAIEEFEGRRWNSYKCRQNAAMFSKNVFKTKMKSVLSI